MYKLILDYFTACCLLLTAAYVQAENQLRVVFYNTENFFDCKDDSLTRDEDFLPGGTYAWSPGRFLHKTEQLARVLAVAGGGSFPHLVGLAEIENEDCLQFLLKSSSLKNAAYRYIYAESADPRGIDVCLLYNRFVFKPLAWESIRPSFPDNMKKTRDLLYVRGMLPTKENLHVFVCHLPSRYGGAKASESFRRLVAGLLRARVDSVFKKEPDARILIMGDFNDEPDDLSLCCDLAAMSPQEPYSSAALYNLMWPLMNNPDYGSHKYQGRWSVIDQIIVSSALLFEFPPQQEGMPLRRLPEAWILFEDFLVIKDQKYLGYKPFRTYEAYRYTGGYSDHLPVCLDIPF